MTGIRLLLQLWACFAVVTLSLAAAQEPSEFRRHRVLGGDASEARRMLMELAGAEAEDAEVIADDAAGELLISGSESLHALAAELLKQLPGTSAAAGGGGEERGGAERRVPLVLRVYESAPGNLPSVLSDIRRLAGAGGGVATDESSGRIYVTSTEAVHRSLRGLRGLRPVEERSESTVRAAGHGGALRGGELEREGERGRVQREESGGNIRLRSLTAGQALRQLEVLLGSRLRKSGGVLVFRGSGGRELRLSVGVGGESLRFTGDDELAVQFSRLVRSLDESGIVGGDELIRFVSVPRTERGVVERAVELWRENGGLEEGGSDELKRGEGIPGEGRVVRSVSPFRPAGMVRQEDSVAVEDEGAPVDEAAVGAGGEQAGRGVFGEDVEGGVLRRPSSDVTVESLPDLDVMILRGRGPDVEELTRIIEEIERLSAETTPEIEVIYLQNVRGENLQELIDEVLDDLTGPLQGRVSITPLIKPNALLLVGWGEAVKAAMRLATRLDEAVVPETQLEVFRLRRASAAAVEGTITDFFSGRGGLGPEVKATADSRTNSILVHAAPRDLEEVRMLIERLDTATSESVNQVRMLVLKNALAADVSATVTAALLAARGGTTGQRSAALEMLLTLPDGSRIASAGLLEDVRLTPDSRTNRILVTGPGESLDLIERLIEELDQTPAAAARIKVFQVTHGDASELVLVLRSLFPEGGTSTVPQMASAEGESSLVAVRFSVDTRTNSIIATGADGDLRIIEALLLRLDQAGSQERINKVMRLKNSPALDVANAVNNFLRSERVVALSAPGRQNPFAQMESEVVVVPEPVGNALIISATPRYFEQIMDLVEGLDAQPPQVMIQVILAEVALDNLQEFGVELGLQDSLLFDRSVLGSIVPPAAAGYDQLNPGFNFNNRPLGNSNSASSINGAGRVGGQALSHFSLGRTNSETEFGGLVLSASSENISVLLRAMNQSRTMEILSRPQVMTLDNQPAFIQVGQRVPRITGTSINQVGQVNSVELENVGLILGVTPRISPEGMVVMEIDAEKSDVGPEIEGIPVSVSADGAVIRSPRVNITTAQTTVSAASGQTIVIGGLITNDNRTTSRRVPWLSEIPVLGHLFRYDSGSSERRELLIILTPHVVRGPNEAERLKQMEMSRMSWISSDIFDWMNPEMPISSGLDDAQVPVVFPDRTPSVSSLSASAKEAEDQGSRLLQSGSEEMPGKGAVSKEGSDAAGSPPPVPPVRAVVPEWKIEQTGAETRAGLRKLSWQKPQAKASSKASTRSARQPLSSARRD
jgi:type II secretion system protein D